MEGAAEVELPAIHEEASRSSQRAQSRFFKLTRAFLVLAAVIAVAGASSWTIGGGIDPRVAPASAGVDVFGVVALVALVGTLFVRRAFDLGEPQKAWYDGRAVAESVKSLAWRYAVGGAPFFCAGHPHAQSNNEVDALFDKRVGEVVDQFLDVVSSGTEASQITDSMRRLRSRSLPERRHEYAVSRVGGQETWYADRSVRNKTCAQRWRRVSVGLEAVGIAVAAVKAGGWLTSVDLLGIVATLLASVAAWTNARQHTTLAESYAVAAQDLASVRQGIERQASEEAWAEFVGNAEAAMSREHTVWRARRSVPTAA